MKDVNKTKKAHRASRHARVRAKVSGTGDRPRVCVFKSNRHVMVQAVDDQAKRTLGFATDAKAKAKKIAVPDDMKALGAKVHQAFGAGQRLAEDLKKLGVSSVVFDAGGFRYHGRVRAVAEGLRKGGIAV
jgi:large subunit ribosomal protein L18